MKITKQEFDKLYSSGISKKEYDTIIDRIEKRFCEIMCHIREDKGWYDFDNEKGEGSPGYFDPEYHKENIGFVGEAKFPEVYEACPAIPTRWLWEDFEQQFKDEVQKYKQGKQAKKLADKEKREKRKENLKRLQESIKTKLTKEELKAINFKK